MTEAVSLNIAVLTLSDSRTLAEDRSGDTLVALLEAAGHKLVSRELIPDDVYKMRAVVSEWIADAGIQVILTTGGTGFQGGTPPLKPCVHCSILKLKALVNCFDKYPGKR